MRDHCVDVSLLCTTGYDDGLPYAQIQPVVAEDASHPGEAYHPFGHDGRARDAERNSSGQLVNGARVLYWYEGNTLHTLALDDPRRTQLLPQLPKGSSRMYADIDDSHAVLSGEDGGYTLTVPSGAKVTVRVKGGPEIVIDDDKVQIGDANAQVLAMGKAFAALWSQLSTVAANLDAAVLAATGTPNSPLMSAFFTAHINEKLQTLIAQGT
jgi:hypothetical protein